MSTCLFPDRDAQPDDAALAAGLGRTKAHWDAIVEHACGSEDAEAIWKYYGKKHGWQLKLMQKRRALLFLVPHKGRFLAGMALREAALDAVRAARLPPDLLHEIETTKPYMEGRPARVEVTSKKDVATIKKLLRIKRAS